MTFWAIKHLPKIVINSLFALSVLGLLTSNFPIFESLNLRNQVQAAEDVTTLTSQLVEEKEEFREAKDSDRDKKSKKLEETAKKRKDLLLQKVKDPKEFKKLLIKDRDQYPEEAKKYIEEKVTKKGYIDILHIDRDDGTTENYYFLYEDKARQGNYVNIVTDVPISGLGSAAAEQEISVDGYQIDSFFAPEGQVSIPVGESSVTAITGNRKVAFFYVSFRNNRTRSQSQAALESYVNNSFKPFINRSSWGRLNVETSVYSLNLPIDQTCELINPLAVFDDFDGALIYSTKNTALAQGIDIYSFRDKIIVLDPTIDCPGLSGQSKYFSGWAFSEWVGSVAHEFGHNMNLGHANGWDCFANVIRNDCSRDEYENITDIMGDGENLSWHDYGPFAKDYLGWFAGGQKYTVNRNGGGNFTLEQYELITTGQGPIYPTKTLFIPTYSGGPAYYVTLRRVDDTRRRVTIELASSSPNSFESTLILDTTPDSQPGSDDFNDAYLELGEEFNDPYNGIIVKTTQHAGSSAQVNVSFYQPTLGTGTLDLRWWRPNGYLSAVGQEKLIDWDDVHYLVDIKCIYGSFCDVNNWNQWRNPDCSSWPMGRCPPYDLTNNSVEFKAAAGFRYVYRVFILTKDDNDPNKLAHYLWVGDTEVNNTCGSGTCNLRIEWPKATYRVNLVRRSDSRPACENVGPPGVSYGCQDFLFTDGTGSNSKLIFRGIPAGQDFRSEVRINDFGGGSHLLQKFDNVGQSNSYFRNCPPAGGVQCTIPALSFVGFEPIMYSIKLNNQDGVAISGPDGRLALADGSFSSNWNWDYKVEVFPNNYSSCAVAGNLCQKFTINNSTADNVTRRPTGLLEFTDYRVRVCASTCYPGSGNPFIANAVLKSTTTGPGFFGGDPFDDTTEVPTGVYSASYFNNPDFTGLVAEKIESQPKIAYRVGKGPVDGMDTDSFSVRWEGYINFDAAKYRFNSNGKGTTKVFIDNMDTPIMSGINVQNKVLDMTTGLHRVKVEHSHNTGMYSLAFNFVHANTCYDISGDFKVNSNDQGLWAAAFTNRANLPDIAPWDFNSDKALNSADQGRLATQVNKPPCN